MFKIPIERPQSTNRSGNKNLKASLVSSILPKKTNEKFLFNYYGTSGRLVFVLFWKNSMTPKIHFEIN